MFQTLEVPELAQLGFRRGEDGEYFQPGSHGFSKMAIVVTSDINHEPVTNVILDGTPVVTLFSEGWDYVLPVPGNNYAEQSFANLMEMLGEFPEEAVSYVADHGLDKLYDELEVGDGHELVAFVGWVAYAMYRQLTDENLTEPEGF